MLIAMEIKAIEITGQSKYLNKTQENDCMQPMKSPMKGAKRAILKKLGFINGHCGKIV